MQARNSNLTIPNLLSGLRLASIPFLIGLAYRGQARLYPLCFAAAILTDLLDGWLARVLHQETELGAKLDLWSDAGVLLSLPLAFLWLWPDVLRSDRWLIGTPIACYALSVALAMWKFRRPASYHTWLGKASVAILSVGSFCVMQGWAHWPFRVGLVLITLSIVEEFAISWVLPVARSNLPSIWHARRLVAQAASKT